MGDERTKLNNTNFLGKIVEEGDIVNDYATENSINASNLYYGVGQSIADELDTKAGAIVGQLMDYPISTLSGWILCNTTKSIGDASSGATETGTDYQALFELLWNVVKVSVSSGTDGYILLTSGGASTTKGANATADWDAHKQIELNLAGLLRVCQKPSDGDFGTSGDTGGEKTHLLSISGMPTHAHTEVIVAFDPGLGNIAVTPSSNFKITGGNTGSTGGGLAHNNLQPFIVAYTFIKY